MTQPYPDGDRLDGGADDDKPLDPAAARVVTRVKWMMAISGLTTLLAVVAVLGAIGYRLLRADGSAAPADAAALLPKNARIVATAVSGERLVVTLDVAGAVEIHTFDLATLRPAGRLRFATEP